MPDVRVLAALLLTACSGAPRSEGTHIASPAGLRVLPDTQTVDGVLIMHHDASAFARASRWVVDTVPEVVIDGGEEFELYGSLVPVLLRDGRSVVVHQVGAAQMMLFDAAGHPERLLARTGSGPGELVRPSGLTLLTGDTILVADGANSTLNWYTADRGLVRTTRLANAGLSDCYRATGQLADGRQVAESYCGFDLAKVDGTPRNTTPLVIYSLDRSRLDTVRMVPGAEMRMMEVRLGSRRYLQPTRVELGRFGSVTAIDSTIVVAGAVGGYMLEFVTSTGRTTGRVVVDAVPRLVTDAMKQALIEERVKSYQDVPSGQKEGGFDEQRFRENMLKVPFADTLPPYARVMSGGDEMFWVLDTQVPGARTWSATAFRHDGAIVGRLEVPSALGRVASFDGSRLVLWQTDEDGVTRAAVLRLRPPS